MNKIVIAGTGYEGLVVGACFAEVGHSVTCIDTDEKKLAILNMGESPIYEADLARLIQKNREAGRLLFTKDLAAYKDADVIFIDVGVPELPDGSADLTNITSVTRKITETVEKDCLVVVKSTVPAGTCDKIEQCIREFQVHPVRIEVACNPDFFSKGSAIRDTLQSTRFVIGVGSKWSEDLLKQIYSPFHCPVITVNRKTAEVMKLAVDNFLALKISYINELANLCELVGVNIDEITYGMSYDERIGNSFLSPGIGFGGSRINADTRALNHLAEKNGYDFKTVKAAIETNKLQWNKLLHAAKKRFQTLEGRKIAVLGLTYKPGTDDCRESPALYNIQQLLLCGADVFAYDPVGIDNFKVYYQEGHNGKGRITYVDTIEAAIDDAELCFIFTEWEKIKKIKPDIYRIFMKTPVIYDGRNLYEVDELSAAGVEYYSIGRRRIGSGKENEACRIQDIEIEIMKNR